MTEDIKVTFIIPKHCRSENDCSEEMQLAFVACEQHCGGGLQAQWVHESKYDRFEGLTKRDVFVLSDFEGNIYEKLRATKCLLVGPRCLSCCLTEGAPIPSGPEPVFTVAMRGLVITASGLTKQQKKSVEKGIPVMSESWVDAVWDTSLSLNINASSADFDMHRLPAFANLQVTTSGISRKDKQMIMKLVNEHGGNFSGAFQSETTDVVILTKEGIGSEKYKAALEYGKACVLPKWVKDSAAKGVALPLANYKVAGASTSSPLAEHRLPDMSLNFSRITNLRPPSNFVDETRSADVSTMSGRMKLSQDSKKSGDTSVDKNVLMAFNNMDMSSIKKAGPIFDGFCIWVTGLEGVCRDRAAACVSRAGGVRYDCPHDRVTHIVAGTRAAAVVALQALPNVPVLSALWLAKSVEAGRALDEAEFLIDMKPPTPKSSKPSVEPASPMSKRNLQLLRSAPPALLPPPAPVELEPPQDIVNHYLSQNMPEPEREKTPEPAAPSVTARNDQTEFTQDEPTEEVEQIFRGIKIEVQGLDEEAVCELGAEIAAAGGSLAAAGAGGSYVLVPLDFDADELLTKEATAVTVFWVKDCLCQQELLPIQYYHRPVKLPLPLEPPAPLHGVVASLSTYSGVERAFLDELAKLLGATTQLRFCRRNTANALASTHLICPSPVGDKYTGALKWGLPAVTADWLMECANSGRRVSERPYLVGDTKAPPSPEPHPIEEVPLESTLVAVEEPAPAPDKENTMLPPAGPAVPRRGSIPSREQTPKALKSDGDNEMSPASRYIAMARQGLLGGDTQETPKRIQDLKDDARQDGECGLRTPPLDDALSTPNLRGLSPTTRRRIQAVRRGEMPSDPIRTPNDPFEKIPTPDSAFGAALRPGSGRMSPEARKRLWKVVNDLPSKQPEIVKDKHTPLSEIRNRFLAQFNSDAPTPPSEHHVAPRKLHLQDQEETPPAKMPKLSADQSAGTASPKTPKTSANESTKSASSASSASSTLPPAVDAQLQRLSAALSEMSGQRTRRSTVTRDSITRPIGPETEPGPESQPNTVGWDDTTPHQPASDPLPTPQIKRFMLSSNVDNREEIIEMIQHLGGDVCEGTELDLEASHLLCCAPGRSEKMLGSVAAGRWVLHPAYIVRSRAAGHFLDEEEYEWGNPKATCLPPLSGAERTLARAAHRWRAARAAGQAGPFAGVVALLHVPPARKRLLARLVTAGDGLAPDDEPPYMNEDITVCFADVKRCPLSSRDTSWLISRRVPVCAPVLLSAYLTDDTAPDPHTHCLPDFRPT
ncbi:DNA topoisomerase 2-binding protein 1-A isoform X2 [Pectinophora gossypiella]|uniref:DNA topoisomerase 2-binding protein 1-A isoform X2 n=1 Tax=Pectinophora gossypiella TaxID=13191 RepID=UPI00214E1717|nr:DNA topoisomerase 2-binding protein 1-A isoform X2 [Pectinophora gossypiella]